MLPTLLRAVRVRALQRSQASVAARRTGPTTFEKKGKTRGPRPPWERAPAHPSRARAPRCRRLTYLQRSTLSPCARTPPLHVRHCIQIVRAPCSARRSLAADSVLPATSTHSLECAPTTPSSVLAFHVGGGAVSLDGLCPPSSTALDSARTNMPRLPGSAACTRILSSVACEQGCLQSDSIEAVGRSTHAKRLCCLMPDRRQRVYRAPFACPLFELIACH